MLKRSHACLQIGYGSGRADAGHGQGNNSARASLSLLARDLEDLSQTLARSQVRQDACVLCEVSLGEMTSYH